MRKEVERARLIQKERLKESGICYNSQIPPGEISTYCKTSEEAEKMLQGAFEKLHLSGRACNRILCGRRLPLSEQETVVLMEKIWHMNMPEF